MNEHDSEKIIMDIKIWDIKRQNNMEEADLIIYNTCLVRENAEVKVMVT